MNNPIDSIPKKLRLPIGCGLFLAFGLVFIAIQSEYNSWMQSRKMARVQEEERIRIVRNRQNRDRLSAIEAAKSPEQREADRIARELKAKANARVEELAKLEKEKQANGVARTEKLAQLEREKEESLKFPKILKLSRGTIRVGMLSDDFVVVVRPSDIVSQFQGEDPDHPGSLIVVKRCLVGKIAFSAHFARTSIPGPYRLISISDVADF